MSEAPQWLKDRGEALRKLQKENPITIQEVMEQWAIQARLRKERAHCPKHAEYDMVKPPESDCAHCWHAYLDRHQTEEARNLLWAAMDKHGGLQM